MKQLSSYMAMNIDGGERVSYTYTEIDDKTGEIISQNNKGSFYAVDPELRVHLDAVTDYIYRNKLEE